MKAGFSRKLTALVVGGGHSHSISRNVYLLAPRVPVRINREKSAC